ncbi:MAG: hypothetical protein IJI57_17375 [Flexilinea sp.]|nr:hypothetical protein [Flexilinea sp.]
MKEKSIFLLFALALALNITAGVLAQDFTETWDETTVLTIFNDFGMVFPDMFADEDSDYIWTDSGPADFERYFPETEPKELEADDLEAKAPAAYYPALEANFDLCGDGMIQYDLTITRDDKDWEKYGGYYGDENVTYIRNIQAYLRVDGTEGYKLDFKKCSSTGGDECHSVTYRRQKDGSYQAHLKGFLTTPATVVMTDGHKYELWVYMVFSTYQTALWPVNAWEKDSYFRSSYASTENGSLKVNTKKDYCQSSLETFDGLYGKETGAVRAKYDQNSGEARLQAVIRNFQPEGKKQNYVIPGEVFAYNSWYTGNDWGKPYKNYVESDRITDYTCKYTLYNVKNAAPLTNTCKFGEGIVVPDHSVVQIDITIDHLSGAVIREADGKDIPFALRLGGMNGEGLNKLVSGKFEPVEFPCPPVTRMQVMNPLKPFMSFYEMDADDPISASGIYSVYEGGLWGMYQKCGKLAYMAVRLKNDGVREEVLDLNRTAVSINGGTPMKWNWVLTTVDADKNNRIYLQAGEDVILFGRAKVTEYPYQLNADTAMTGAVNFLDYGLYISGKVYSDHNNTRCY